MTQPASGTTTFDNLDSSVVVVPTGQSGLTVRDLNGWDFSMQLGSPANGQNETLIVEKDGSSG